MNSKIRINNLKTVDVYTFSIVGDDFKNTLMGSANLEMNKSYQIKLNTSSTENNNSIDLMMSGMLGGETVVI